MLTDTNNGNYAGQALMATGQGNDRLGPPKYWHKLWPRIGISF